MEKDKISIEIPKTITDLTDAEFLSFLYSERDREESLNSYQGWNVWAVAGALITVVCAIYGILSAHIDEIDRIRVLYLVSRCLGTIFLYWQAVSFYMSFMERKRAKDYKKIKFLKDVAPIPYLIVVTACSLLMTIDFIIVNIVNDFDWNVMSISWIVLAVSNLLICINVYANRNAIVWAVKNEVWFAKTWHMVAVGLFVLTFFWLIWKWSRENVLGPFVGTSEFELAACFTAIVMLVYLLLKIKFANRKSSEIDVLIDEYVYKGRSKDVIYRQLRANQMGYGILEACSRELYSLKDYSDTFEQQKRKLDEVRESFIHGAVDVDCFGEQFRELKRSLDYNDEWAARVDALYDKVNEIDRNVPELRKEEEFVNMLKIVGYMMKKGRDMNSKIKSVIDETQKFMNGVQNDMEGENSV